MNMSELPTRITFLLICVVTVTSQVSWFPTIVTALLPLLLGLLAVLGDVAASATVVAGYKKGIFLKFTVFGKMT